MLDQDDVDTGVLEPDEALERVAQDGRCSTDQDLVRMVVEGDDRRPGSVGGGCFPQPGEQVGVTAMQAVERSNDEIESAEPGSQAVEVVDPARHELDSAAA